MKILGFICVAYSCIHVRARVNEHVHGDFEIAILLSCFAARYANARE